MLYFHSSMNSIELPSRVHTKLQVEEQIDTQPAPHAAQQAVLKSVGSKRRNSSSLYIPRAPASKEFTFSPSLAFHCDVRDYFGQCKPKRRVRSSYGLLLSAEWLIRSNFILVDKYHYTGLGLHFTRITTRNSLILLQPLNAHSSPSSEHPAT